MFIDRSPDKAIAKKVFFSRDSKESQKILKQSRIKSKTKTNENGEFKIFLIFVFKLLYIISITDRARRFQDGKFCGHS